MTFVEKRRKVSRTSFVIFLSRSARPRARTFQAVGTLLSIVRDFDCLLRGAMRIGATIRQQMRLAQMLR